MRAFLRFAFVVTALSFVATCLAVPVASAQTSSTSGGASDLAGPRSVGTSTALTDEQAAMEESRPRADLDNGISPRLDLTDHDYFSAGAFMRGLVIPDFVLNWFVHYYGSSIFNGGGGGYFAFRRNGLTVTFEVWYAGFGAQAAYNGTNNQPWEVDYVNSQLGVVFGNVAFQWAVPVNEWFAIDIGIGLGLGGVVGNMWRQDATPAAGGYVPCPGPGMGAPGYCPNADTNPANDGTYQISGVPGVSGHPNPFGFGGGLVPPIFPWLDIPRITLRFTPIRQIVGRIDLGYSVYSFNFGASLGYQF
jgi:hypothetical protein